MEQNLSLYKIFNTVARTENISHAAKELFISQPAISKAIGKLEDDLAVLLFNRTSRGVKLTNEGKMLYEHTKSAFETLALGEENLRKMNQLGIGEIRIGVTATLCKYILLPLLQNFVQAYPHIKIMIDCQSTALTISQMETGHIDIGLVIEPSITKNLTLYPLGQIEDIFVATSTYMNNLKERNTLDDFNLFRDANLMLLDKENVTRQYLDTYLASIGIETKAALEVTNMDLLIDFAKIGIGVSGVVKEFVLSELNNKELVEIPIGFPIPKRNVCFARGNSHTLSKSAKIFLEYIESTNG